jgi:hypothetical protein
LHQHQLAVAVVDAFRQPRGSGRVKGRRLDVLIKVIELELRGSSSKQFFVFANELKFAGCRRFAIGEDDKPFDFGQFRQDRMHKVDELIIDEQRRRTGMVDRIGDLLRRQPHVHRLQDPHHRDGEERF